MSGWTESGLMAASLNQSFGNPATTLSWISGTNKLALMNNTETPNFHATLASTGAGSAAYATTNEVSGTGWAAGGVACSALATGSASIFTNAATNLTITGPTPSALNWVASNVSVATTTLSGAYGCYIYSTTSTTTNLIIIGITFGGSGYSTTAGTFAITWSGGIIASVSCATT
jgi:hypothetical protein